MKDVNALIKEFKFLRDYYDKEYQDSEIGSFANNVAYGRFDAYRHIVQELESIVDKR